MTRHAKQTATRILLCALWGAGVLACLYAAALYSNTPGEVLAQSRQWPRETHVSLAADRPTLLVALHPRCVCSRATLTELASLLTQIRVPVKVQILIYQPDKAQSSWAHSDLIEQARSIPGAQIGMDRMGLEAKRFGMAVSGHAAVYSPQGQLLFSGGITPARGEVGENAGRTSIVSIFRYNTPKS